MKHSILTTTIVLAFAVCLAASCKQEPEAVLPTSISISPASASIVEGESINLNASVSPSNAEYSTIQWKSSDTKVATVNNGNVTAIAPGEVTITASTEGVSGTAKITVTKKYVPVSGIKVTDIEGKDRNEWLLGTIFTLTAAIEPENATDKSITWEATTDCASVTQDGEVAAVKCGDCTIKVKGADNSSGEYYFVIKAIPVESAKVIDPDGKSEGEGIMGSTIQLSTVIEPENATNTYTTWKTGNTAVADVDDNGLVTLKGIGETKITAVIGANSVEPVYADYKLTVKAVEVTSIEVEPSTLTLTEGESAQLKARILPENASYQEVLWTSGNSSIATVDNDGIVKAIKQGSVKIYASAKDNSKINTSCLVTVEPDKTLLGISLSQELLNLTVGSTKTLIVCFNPEYAANKNVTWKSSDNDVATVDANGTVTGVAEGNATITVTSEEGGFTASCAVTVSYTMPEGTKVFVYEPYDYIIHMNGEKFASNVSGIIVSDGMGIYYYDARHSLFKNKSYYGVIPGVMLDNQNWACVNQDRLYAYTCHPIEKKNIIRWYDMNTKEMGSVSLDIVGYKLDGSFSSKVVPAKDGGVYFSGGNKDITGEYVLSLYKLDAKGSLSLVRTYLRAISKLDSNGNNLADAYTADLHDLAIDEEGNVYALVYAKVVERWNDTSEYRVYKNGEILYRYDNASLNSAYCMAIHGSDVYVALGIQSSAEKGDWAMWKNDKPLYEGLTGRCREIEVSDSGDVYYIWNDNKIYKNEACLYSFDNGIEYLTLID